MESSTKVPWFLATFAVLFVVAVIVFVDVKGYLDKQGQCAKSVTYVPATTGAFGESEHYTIGSGYGSGRAFKTHDEAMSACMSN